MKQAKITVFKTILTQDTPYFITLEDEVKRIKGGARETVEKIKRIRKGEIDLKRKLPSVVFQGVFSYRSADHMESHSGLMVFDIDKLTEDDYPDVWQDVITNPHTVLAFRSPSGNGIKAVVRVPSDLDKNTHPKVFCAFQEHFQWPLDDSGKDVARVCFESYDPDVYVNYDAVVFDHVAEDTGISVSDAVPVLPVTDHQKIMDRILAWNWRSSFSEGERNNHLFKVASAFCEFGVPKSTAEMVLKMQFPPSSDFTATEHRNTIGSAYRTQAFGVKYFEDYERIDLVRADMKKPKEEVLSTHQIDEQAYEQIKNTQDDIVFWSINEKGKVTISNYRLKTWLQKSGYKKYYQGENNSPTFVHVKSNIVSLTSMSRIKDFVLDFFSKRGELKVWEYFSRWGNIFSENYLNFLENIELMLMRDKKDKCYIAFENGILEVTKEGYRLTGYIDSDAYVWRSHILPRNWEENTDTDNDYKRFIHNISGGDIEPFECAIGYLISTYKDRTENKAIILNDQNVSANAEGGTGKGIFVQGVANIRNTTIIDGKNYKPSSQFALQTVNLDTLVLCFDDVAKNFPFENVLFSAITEGLTIERKNKDAIKLSVKESPKVVITTNYTIPGDGASHERRRHELELTDHYKPDFTPKDEFGRSLFDDWEADDFNRFDNYMVHCLMQYLSKGLVKQESKNLKTKKFIRATSEDFFNWAKDGNLPVNTRLNHKELYHVFIDDYPDAVRGKWKLPQRNFKQWIEKFAKYENLKYIEGNTNGIGRWLMLESDEKTDINEFDEVPF